MLLRVKPACSPSSRSLAWNMGDRDTDYVKEYRQALLDGKSVLAVVAKGEHMRDHVRHTLKSQGAHFVVLFGRFAVEVLES